MADTKAKPQITTQLIDQWRGKLVLNLLRGTLLAVLLVSLFAIPFYLDTYAHSLPDWELIGIGLTVVLIVILGVLSFA